MQDRPRKIRIAHKQEIRAGVAESKGKSKDFPKCLILKA